MAGAAAGRSTPLVIVSVSVPIPSMTAPIFTRHSARSLTSGSRAALISRGLAGGERRRHHQVLGRPDRDLRKHDLRAGQPVRRPRLDVALLERDLGAELFQALEMQVDRPGTDGAAARQRDLGLALARQQRAEHQNARPHLAHQVVGRPRAGQPTGLQVEGAAAMAAVLGMAVHLDLDAETHQQVGQRRDVGEMRQVGEPQRLVGQEAGGHQRQGRVLGAGDPYLALQGSAAANENSVHVRDWG